MTEEIIIDGVDVKHCKRRIGKDNYCRYYKRPCSENNFNCIWKKYLRKEQECETLSSQLDFEVQKKECLEQECEKINQALNEIEKLAKHNNFLVRDPFCGTGYRDLSGQILSIINKTKEDINES